METTLHNEAAGSQLAATWEFDLGYVPLARFAALVVERGFEHVGSKSWATERMTLEGMFDRATSTLRDSSERAAVLNLTDVVGEECFAHLSLCYGRAHFRAAARSVDALATAQAWMRERYPVTQREELQQLTVKFWSMSRHGGRWNSRQIDVPTWSEVETNYPSRVRRALDPLVAKAFEPGQGGRLLLWHGEPGTGKTYALRALGWEWRSWCDLHYITDPETFFGSSPAYMLDVILDDSDDDDGEDKRWRLLVLEDTGELLAADAKDRTGQGLSRLLNVVDGMIGQGLRILVLVTTNETLRKLHPAVSRPGRCASQIEFVAFPPEEAAEWRASRGLDGDPGAGTLASLFAQPTELVAARRPRVGFGC